MNEKTGVIGGSLVGLALFAFGAAGGWYARGEELQRQVIYYRHENELLRREV